MRISLTIAALVVAITTIACGATTTNGTQTTPNGPALTSAAVTFVTRDNGKDADSGLTVQLLRRNAELAAETRTTGTGFDDDTTSPPMALTIAGPFRMTDVADSQLRIRMTPDGRDDWRFDAHLRLGFSDGTTRSYQWPNITLNNEAPERTLTLSGAQVP